MRRTGLKAAAERRVAPGQAGATLIEFALLAPVFLALVFGIIVYGLYFATDLAVTYAASEAARVSEAGLSDSERESLATSAAEAVIAAYSPVLSPAAATITTGPVAGNAGLFQVTVSYDFASFGLQSLARLLPIPATDPSASVIVSHGGY